LADTSGFLLCRICRALGETGDSTVAVGPTGPVARNAYQRVAFGVRVRVSSRAHALVRDAERVDPMSKLARAAVAAACKLGATAAMITPASAAGTATYNCGAYGTVSAVFTRPAPATVALVVNLPLITPTPIPPGGIVATLNGPPPYPITMTNPAPIPPLPIRVTGFVPMPLPAPPSTITFTVTPPGFSFTCILVGVGAGWPV